MGRFVEPRAIWRTARVDGFGLLVDAADYYGELFRAARTAKKCVLLAGWQFDSEVQLLRGSDALEAEEPVTLLPFLNHLCETRPRLQVCLLAWDFNVVFAAEREWMQELVFHWNTHERLSFRFDPNHVDLGSLHQKYVVVDDDIVFTGGLDVCDHRWDDRRHLFENPHRTSRGERHGPYHDVQLWAKSRDLACALKELFARRWENCGGGSLRHLSEGPLVRSTWRPRSAVPIAAREVSLSRTDAFAMPEGGERPAAEVLRLFLRAIAEARELIYVETQYFSSRAIADALIARMRRSPLQLVLVLNMRGKTLREQAAVGLAQAQNCERLKQVAAETGSRLGLYYTLPCCEVADRPEKGTYIHSKVLIVDDVFLSIGSANLTNRSMGVDTELNVNVEAEDGDEALAGSIRAARAGLLAEHSGLPAEVLEEARGLVDRIEQVMGPDGDGCRLRRMPSPSEAEQKVLELVDPDRLPFDPDHVEPLDSDQRGGLLRALTRAMHKLLTSPRALQRKTAES